MASSLEALAMTWVALGALASRELTLVLSRTFWGAEPAAMASMASVSAKVGRAVPFRSLASVPSVSWSDVSAVTR